MTDTVMGAIVKLSARITRRSTSTYWTAPVKAPYYCTSHSVDFASIKTALDPD